MWKVAPEGWGGERNVLGEETEQRDNHGNW